MSSGTAVQIFKDFGVSNVLSLSHEELKSMWQDLVKKYHPDKGGKNIDMQWINAAYDVLKIGDWKHDKTGGWKPDATRTGQDPVSDNPVQDNPKDLRYVRRKAWEMAGMPSSNACVYQFWNWDGNFFHGEVEAYGLPTTLFKVSKLVADWADSSVAVFFTKKSDFSGLEEMTRRIYLINVRGKEVSPIRGFEFESINNNPGNDKSFINSLRNLL